MNWVENDIHATLAANHSIVEGVVHGIAGYGNCFGVPNLGGETRFAFARLPRLDLGPIAARDLVVGVSVGGALKGRTHDALLGARRKSLEGGRHPGENCNQRHRTHHG